MTKKELLVSLEPTPTPSTMVVAGPHVVPSSGHRLDDDAGFGEEGAPDVNELTQTPDSRDGDAALKEKEHLISVRPTNVHLLPF
jgi:hypothetical protein